MQLYYPNGQKIPSKWIWVPVPSTNESINRRGFCHTVEILRTLSSTYNFTYQEILYKKSGAKRQVGKDRIKRINGVRNTIGINQAKTIPQNIILFDDVVTTGSTLNECCRVIKKASPSTQIRCVTLARGKLKFPRTLWR